MKFSDWFQWLKHLILVDGKMYSICISDITILYLWYYNCHWDWKTYSLQLDSPKITALHVNGQDVNGTHVGEQHQEVNVSCYFTNGSPLVSIRILDDTGHTLSSTTHGQGPLTLSLGVYHCQDNWPVIRCEALGSEINRSVAIVVRCEFIIFYSTL